jgi:cytochrome c-type biogenesis protein CcmH
LVALLPGRALQAQETPGDHPPPATGGAAGAEEIKSVTTRVLCPCGTCVNQTLHECTCGTAAHEREKIATALASGEAPDAVVESYVDAYGLQILTAPEKKGYNLVGWMVPFIVALAGLGALTLVLRRWVGAVDRPARIPGESAPGEASEDESYRERLERELKEFRI